MARGRKRLCPPTTQWSQPESSEVSADAGLPGHEENMQAVEIEMKTSGVEETERLHMHECVMQRVRLEQAREGGGKVGFRRLPRYVKGNVLELFLMNIENTCEDYNLSLAEFLHLLHSQVGGRLLFCLGKWSSTS